MTPEQFLNVVINSGFNTLRASRIKYAVKKEEQQEAVSAWILMLIGDCNWNEHDDLKRMSEAFKFIARNDQEFPSIARFIEVLQPRKRIPPHQHLEHKKQPLTEEEKKNKQAFHHMLKNTISKLKAGVKL